MKKILVLSLVTAAYAVAGSSQLFSGGISQQEVQEALEGVKTIMLERGLKTEDDFGDVLDALDVLVYTEKDINIRANKHTSLTVEAETGRVEITAPCLVKFRCNPMSGDDQEPEIANLINIEK